MLRDPKPGGPLAYGSLNSLLKWAPERYGRFMRRRRRQLPFSNISSNGVSDVGITVRFTQCPITTHRCAPTLTQRPEVALAFAATFARHLHEALVQAEIVANGILPAFFVLLVVRETVRDVRVNLAQRFAFHFVALRMSELCSCGKRYMFGNDICHGLWS